MKRAFDIILSFFGLLFTSPILLPVIFLVWRQDGYYPFYIAERVGKGGRIFKMVKLRSMIIHADKTGVDSTSANDKRITPLGHFIRKYKLDELTQLWNVLIGDMSLVGPRPNVKRETDLYTHEEQKLLTVKPGITDFASIIFADEGEILKGYDDPDLAYNQLIRPGKGYLGLFYIANKSVGLDLMLCYFTALLIFSREKALSRIQDVLLKLGADKELLKLASRKYSLEPMPPPGATKVVMSRQFSSNL